MLVRVVWLLWGLSNIEPSPAAAQQPFLKDQLCPQFGQGALVMPKCHSKEMFVPVNPSPADRIDGVKQFAVHEVHTICSSSHLPSSSGAPWENTPVHAGGLT